MQHQWKEMFRCAQHDGNVIPNAKLRDLKKTTLRYLTFVRYDTIREPVILSEANQRSTPEASAEGVKVENLNATPMERDVSLRST